MRKIPFVVCLLSFFSLLNNITAQDFDSLNIVNENPIKMVLDEFLPDTIGEFFSLNDIRGDISSDLRGCFKSYGINSNVDESLFVSIRRGELSPIRSTEDGPTSRIEKAITISGNPAKIITSNLQSSYISVQVAVSGKIIIFVSPGGEESVVIDFASTLNYLLIDSL